MFGIIKCFIIDICDCETRRAHFDVMVTSAEIARSLQRGDRFELSTRHFKQKKEYIISSVFPISLQIMCNFNISAKKKKNIYISVVWHVNTQEHALFYRLCCRVLDFVRPLC